VHGTTNQAKLQPVASPPPSIMDYQKEGLELIKNSPMIKYIQVDITPLLSMNLTTFLEEFQQANDIYFFLVWCSYGTSINLFLPFNEIFTIIPKSSRGEEIFNRMKDNYKKFLFRKLLGEQNQEAIVLAQALYSRKFRIVWKKLVKPNSCSFKPLDQTFNYIQSEMGRTIPELLEFEFNEFFRGFTIGNIPAKILHGERFRLLVYCLSNDESESFGLNFVSEHENPFFVLFYFYFLDAEENSPSIATKDRITERAYRNLRGLAEYQISINDKKLEFLTAFKNTFPTVVNEEELKTILLKINTKLNKAKWV
jgi:hypothetical protein